MHSGPTSCNRFSVMTPCKCLVSRPGAHVSHEACSGLQALGTLFQWQKVEGWRGARGGVPCGAQSRGRRHCCRHN